MGRFATGTAVRVSTLLTVVLVALLPQTASAAGLSDATFERVVVLLAAVGVGYVITHLAVERLAQRFSLAGGIEYVALGVVLGPGLGILHPELIYDLRPILLLGAGALGMLAGLELGTRETGPERIPGTWAAATTITAFTAACVIGLPLGVAWALGYDIEGDHAWTAALLFAGVVALGSDGAVLDDLARSLGVQGPTPAFGVAVANRVRALATVGFGILFATIDDTAILEARPWARVLEALGVQLAAGVTFGLLFGLVVYRKLDERTLLTVVVGMVFLAGGFAYALDVSGIFVNFVAGLTFALTSAHAGEATRTMQSIKKPFVIALYFFAGLHWVVGQLWIYALIVPFLALRRLGRVLGGALAARLGRAPTNLGAATVAPGGLTLAFVLSVGLVYRVAPGIIDVYGPLVTTLILLELASQRAARRWLVDATGVGSDLPGRPRSPT